MAQTIITRFCILFTTFSLYFKWVKRGIHTSCDKHSSTLFWHLSNLVVVLIEVLRFCFYLVRKYAHLSQVPTIWILIHNIYLFDLFGILQTLYYLYFIVTAQLNLNMSWSLTLKWVGTPQPPWTFNPLPGNLGSWFSVWNLILNQLEEVWRNKLGSPDPPPRDDVILTSNHILLRQF